MTNPKHPTEPNMRPVSSGVPAPPKFLLWGVITLFILLIVGFFFGIWAFNSLLTSGQQVRVINRFAFMENFQDKQPTPQGGILPTVDPNTTSSNDASSLLDMDLSGGLATATIEATRAGLLVSTNTPTPLPTDTPTILPTNTPIPTMAATSAPTSAGDGSDESLQDTQQVSIPATSRNFGFQWARQTWNNCGPATITTTLSYFGWVQDQEYAKSFLRPNREDKNVSPHELVGFVTEQSQVSALWRMGGNLDLLKSLISAGFPVIVERGMMFEANDWLGHYQALVAYDDGQGVFYAYDSFLGNGTGEGVPMRYSELDEDWRAFNRTFIVMYQPSEAALLQSILGDYWDADRAAEIALEAAQQEARANQTDGFAWNSMGTSLVALGRYQEAAAAYDLARQAGNLPWRILWYQFGMFEAYYNVGRYDDVISLAQSNLNQAEELEESYYWRGMALAAQGNNGDAASNFRSALRYNSNYDAAREALDSLNG
ncbi:MAG: tetratricopeptide repeat protein [Anaerolineae bacterium]|nr:tetratricopeptide repeat protein [Anaerolineae bacterium]MDQ7036993.1 tetratricopeptide repeat protein [Anaerolineae bacterium]